MKVNNHKLGIGILNLITVMLMVNIRGLSSNLIIIIGFLALFILIVIGAIYNISTAFENEPTQKSTKEKKK